jgi:hypothetical protein
MPLKRTKCDEKLHLSIIPLLVRVVIPGVRRPFGGRTGWAGGRPCPLRLIWTGRGTVDREITVPNLLYCSNFSYYLPPTWSRGGWQSEVAAHGSVPAPVWSLYLPWAVSQCPFDPYRAGAKVYRAYQAGGRPAPQTTLLLLDVYVVQWFLNPTISKLEIQIQIHTNYVLEYVL